MARGSHLAAFALLLLGGTFCMGDRAAPGAGDGSVAADSALRARVAELLPDVERLSGLPAREPLMLGIRSRAELETFLEQELNEQFADGRIQNLVRVYARFGLVPDTLDLEPLLSGLLMEQVAGFYDPESDTLFVVEGIAEELVEGVLVHEMVHALQDQYVDLDSLVEGTRGRNDPGMAVQAAIEGHATFVMYEWMLSRMMGQEVDLTQMPRIAETFDSEALAAAGVEMPELQQAPAVIREQLLFPYVAGLDFIQVRWGGPGGRVPPLGEALPTTTEQVLHPRRWGAPEVEPPSALEFAAGAAAGAGWSEVYRDGMGEADIRILLRQFLEDEDRADAAARGWDGDVYRLLEGSGGEVLVWVSRWDAAAEATEFARAARLALAARYADVPGRTVTVERMGDRLVRIIDAPAGVSPPAELLELASTAGTRPPG